MKTLIQNGTVVNPKGAQGRLDILIENGVIVQMAEHLAADDAVVVEAAGKTVCPGFCDMHVHFREPGQEYKETIRTGAMAAVAGVLLGQFYGVINPYIGFMAGMKAFTAAVLGGIGSIPGAMIGGLILGIAEALSSAYLSTEYKDVVSFALLILVLLVMPTGILGRPEVEKV